MPQEPFPSYGQGGEPPLPGAAPGNGDAEPDHIPADEPVQQGLTIHLADVTDPATADLAGLAKDGAVDTMAPGAALLALAEAACAPGTLTGLTDNQVLGLAGAARRLAGVAAWLELAAASEFAGRRVTGNRPAKVAGEILSEFAGDELAPELRMTPFAAAEHLAYARTVTRRLPATIAALRAGRIDGYRVRIVAEATQWLTDAHAAEADQILAISATELTYGRLRSAAARLAMMLDPEAARRRKDEASKNARVSLFREEAGTAGLSGRDLPVGETFASFANVKARAAAYKDAGIPGTITELRAKALLDLLQEKDSRDVLLNAASTNATGVDGARADGTGATGEEEDAKGAAPGGAAHGDARFPVAALINITVPLATLLGISAEPGEAAGFGLLDPGAARDLAAMASQHPATRWCLTVIGEDGTAAAHGCAAGRHRYDFARYPPGGGNSGNGGNGRNRDGPGTGFLPGLKIRLSMIAKGDCGHRHHEPGHDPSRALAHLVRARSVRCTAPGCGRPAARCDLDHTHPWEQGGLTCQCNIGPLCRHHHRCKQSEGWKLEQPAPGVMCWRTPAGRYHTTRPATYHA